jgi:MarR family transcriptional regulator, temperature-dependent positive regulator of motility
VDQAAPTIVSAPLDLRAHAGHLIRRVQQAHRQLWSELVSDDLTSAQFAVLNILQEKTALDQRTLGDLLGMDRSTIAEIVQRLADRQLITRFRDPADRRRNLVRLTPAGSETLRTNLTAAHQVTNQLIGVLTGHDQQELVRILNLLVDAHHP